MYEIYNKKTGDTFGREFPTKSDAVKFVKYLQAGTSLKLHWATRKVKNAVQANPVTRQWKTVEIRRTPAGEVQVRKVTKTRTASNPTKRAAVGKVAGKPTRPHSVQSDHRGMEYSHWVYKDGGKAVGARTATDAKEIARRASLASGKVTRVVSNRTHKTLCTYRNGVLQSK